MAARIRAGTPVGSCPDCLSFGPSYGSQSYCRACYDFTRRYDRGQCAGCARIIAVKKRHCRLCWLQAGIAATGRRITPADFARVGRYQQLSFAGMTRLGHSSPRPAVPAARRPRRLHRPEGHSCSCRSPVSPCTSTSATGSHRHSPARPWRRPGTSPPSSPRPAAGTPGSSSRPAGHWPSYSPATCPET